MSTFTDNTYFLFKFLVEASALMAFSLAAALSVRALISRPIPSHQESPRAVFWRSRYNASFDDDYGDYNMHARPKSDH